MHRKGQVSIEQLLITAIALTFVAVMFYFSVNFATDSIRQTQAKDTVDKLSKAADYVYTLGSGTKQSVQIQMPSGVEFLNISDHRIDLRVALSSGDEDVFANTQALLIGQVPINSGLNSIAVFATANNSVFIGNSYLSCTPALITQSFQEGQTGNSTINVSNIGTATISELNASASDLGGILTITPPDSVLVGGNSTSVGLNFNVPSTYSVGNYGSTLTVTGNDSSQCTTQLSVFVTRAGGPDIQGPLVTSITVSPNAPNISSLIVINATGDDSTTGGSTISLCQLQIDNSGIWNDMNALGGGYNTQVVQPVTYTVGTLGPSWHNISIRCTDSARNMGPISSIRFSVHNPYLKDILFVTVGASPTGGNEQLWINWINSHNSSAGYAWNMDVVSVASVDSGSTNVSLYRTVILADSPTTDATYYPILKSYMVNGNYVTLLNLALLPVLISFQI